MANRLFEDDDLARCYQEHRLDYVDTGIDHAIVSFLRQKLMKEPESLAVDVACGTGFLTRLIASNFTKVCGLDVSAAQIKVAKENTKNENISYRLGKAEDLSFLESNSVDLVTVALAIQYFDTSKFFFEVDRVLKPNGCVAIITYNHLPDQAMVTFSADPTNEQVRDRCQALMDELHALAISQQGEVVKKLVHDQILPAPDYPETHVFTSKVEKVGNVDIFVGYLKAMGGIRTYFKKTQYTGKLYEDYEKKLLTILREISPTPENVKLTIGSLLHCYVYRKP